MSVHWRQLSKNVGPVEKFFLLLLALWLALTWSGSTGTLPALVSLATLISGIWTVVRLGARLIRNAIWQLRNRLYVTYVFIAFVPIILLLVLLQLGASFMAQQIGVFLVNSELDRRLTSIDRPALAVERTPRGQRVEAVRRTGFVLSDSFPGLQVLVKDGNEQYRFPETSSMTPPPEGWGDARGLVVRDGRFHAWSHLKRKDLEVVILAPITRRFLLNLVPNLGSIDLVWFPDPYDKNGRQARRAQPFETAPGEAGGLSAQTVPLPANRLDRRVLWATPVRVAIWDSPGVTQDYLLSVHTRISAILGIVFNRQGDQGDQGPQGLLLLLYVFITLFLVAELVSLLIGVSLTRTITSAIQALYEGTLRIKEGDLSHHIPVKGNDQLADLTVSFNTMTENLQRLVVVEKERERLHAELEIAREVQNALHPRVVPELRTLRMTAACNAARMVSGDYYDYQMVGPSRIAIAVGDVAGKGISAALLMATVQSSFRTQIRACLEAAAAAGNGGTRVATAMSTSALVTQLNQQLYDYTAAEKFATFYHAVYDDDSGLLTYTNAGHLPPMLIRDGEIRQSEINGMVVGAFPFAQYGESRVQLEPGDLLVCFTDGVTEPENEYGEMFGEERLAEVILKHSHRHEREIIQAVVESVREWTGSPELQDDLTLLLARRFA